MTSPAGSGSTAVIEEAKVALQQAIETVQTANRSVVDGFNSIVSWVNDHRVILGPIPLYLIKNDLDDMRGHIEKVVDLGSKVVNGGTPVISLFVASIDWLPTVMRPTSEVSYDISKPADDNLHYWQGEAFRAYVDKQARQKKAVDRTVNNAAFISGWLFEIGKANVAYATRLAKILVDVATDLIKITTNGLTIINVQFALDGLAGAIKKIVQEGLNQLIETGERFIGTLGNLRSVLEQVSDSTDYEGNRWPQAVYR